MQIALESIGVRPPELRSASHEQSVATRQQEALVDAFRARQALRVITRAARKIPPERRMRLIEARRLAVALGHKDGTCAMGPDLAAASRQPGGDAPAYGKRATLLEASLSSARAAVPTVAPAVPTAPIAAASTAAAVPSVITSTMPDATAVTPLKRLDADEVEDVWAGPAREALLRKQVCWAWVRWSEFILCRAVAHAQMAEAIQVFALPSQHHPPRLRSQQTTAPPPCKRVQVTLVAAPLPLTRPN